MRQLNLPFFLFSTADYCCSWCYTAVPTAVAKGWPGLDALSLKFLVFANSTYFHVKACDPHICDVFALYAHGRRSRGDGETSPPRIWSGELSPQILSCCKILSTRLLALQCRKMCFFCLDSRTFIVSPAMRPPRIPVRSTPMFMQLNWQY